MTLFVVPKGLDTSCSQTGAWAARPVGTALPHLRTTG